MTLFGCTAAPCRTSVYVFLVIECRHECFLTWISLKKFGGYVSDGEVRVDGYVLGQTMKSIVKVGRPSTTLTSALFLTSSWFLGDRDHVCVAAEQQHLYGGLAADLFDQKRGLSLAGPCNIVRILIEAVCTASVPSHRA